MTEEVSLSYLKSRVSEFIEEREWGKYHTPKNIAESIVIEASELLQIFQWINNVDSLNYGLENRDKVEEELADIIIYCLSMANVLNINLTRAVLNKLEKNRRKYPVEKFKGVYYKPDSK